MSIIISLVGGLGCFLYGMKMMSAGLQKVAGSRMRSILEVFTKNRIIGVLVGTFFTALIQSSNARNYIRSKHWYDSYRAAYRL